MFRRAGKFKFDHHNTMEAEETQREEIGPKCFTLVNDKLASSSEVAIQWCPTMDLLALFRPSHIWVHRFLSWQRLYSFVASDLETSAQFTALVWRPDGDTCFLNHFHFGSLNHERKDPFSWIKHGSDHLVQRRQWTTSEFLLLQANNTSQTVVEGEERPVSSMCWVAVSLRGMRSG